jgi:DNA repair ATPase RecN
MAAQRLEQAITAELQDMDLARAIFRVDMQSDQYRAPFGSAQDRRKQAANPSNSEEYDSIEGMAATANGIDNIEFLWSANPGEPPRSLAKIASGGELSRLMLAVKSVLCRNDLVSVYVFDEVDTGLGGKAADSVSRATIKRLRLHI